MGLLHIILDLHIQQTLHSHCMQCGDWIYTLYRTMLMVDQEPLLPRQKQEMFHLRCHLLFQTEINIVLMGGQQLKMVPLHTHLEQHILEIIHLHYMQFGQEVLFRDAGFAIVWKKLLVMSVMGAAFLIFALKRFRSMLASQG